MQQFDPWRTWAVRIQVGVHTRMHVAVGIPTMAQVPKPHEHPPSGNMYPFAPDDNRCPALDGPLDAKGNLGKIVSAQRVLGSTVAVPSLEFARTRRVIKGVRERPEESHTVRTMYILTRDALSPLL